jgi:hypothetical protein
MMKHLLRKLSLAGLGIGLGMSAVVPSAIAAEQVVIHYLMFERSIAVEDLATFAETGELSNDLERYVEQTGKDPEALQNALNRTVPMRLALLDLTLNTFLGELLLDEVGQLIRTPSDTANREALRSALVLSAADDDAISVIELVENYPTSEVHLEGDRIVDTYYAVSLWSDRAQELFDVFETLSEWQADDESGNEDE